MRSREKWVEFGEKNNSYFLGLEKKRQVKKSISKLMGDNGEIISDQEKLLNKIKDYYENLYNKKSLNKDLTEEYISDTKLENTVDENDKLICDGKITVEECTYGIFKMKLNKSPGLDGLTVEFIDVFGINLNHYW